MALYAKPYASLRPQPSMALFTKPYVPLKAKPSMVIYTNPDVPLRSQPSMAIYTKPDVPVRPQPSMAVYTEPYDRAIRLENTKYMIVNALALSHPTIPAWKGTRTSIKFQCASCMWLIMDSDVVPVRFASICQENKQGPKATQTNWPKIQKSCQQTAYDPPEGAHQIVLSCHSWTEGQ